MKLIKSILICLLGAFFYLAIGWFVFAYCLGAYSAAHTTSLIGFKKSETSLSVSFLFLSCLAYAIIIFYLQQLSVVKSARGAVLQAALIGLLIAMMTDFYWYGTSTFYTGFTAVLVDLVAAFISVGLLGGFMFGVKSLLLPFSSSPNPRS